MEHNQDSRCTRYMNVKELNTVILLLSILLISITFKKRNIHISDNQVSIIEYYQNPIYRYQKFPEKNWQDNPKIEIDTASTYKDIMSNVEPNSGGDWIKRYQSGVRFEFNPPR